MGECFHSLCGLKKKSTSMMKLYKAGHDRYEAEMDVIWQLKVLRKANILMK
jgi:hypothetical protein